MIENFIRNIHGLWRAETIIADLHFRQLLTRTIFKAFAGLVAVFGLLMLNVTAFFALEQYFGRVWSAASVSFFDFAVAGILVAVSATRPRSREMALALEVRQSAIQGFESDARLIQDQFSTLSNEIRGIKASMTNFVKHPLDEAMSQLIVPLSAIIVRSLSKKRASKSAVSSTGDE
jgi:hypothetical protein